MPATSKSYYSFTIGHNTTAILAACGTFLFTGLLKNPFRKTGDTEISASNATTTGSSDHTNEKSSHSSNHGNTNSCNVVHQANRKILQHLCFGVEADTQWSQLSEHVRRLILSRVLGTPGHINAEVATWLSKQPMSLRQHDDSLKRCLAAFESIKESGVPAQTPLAEPKALELTSIYARNSPRYSVFGRAIRYTVHAADIVVKWIAIITGAAPDTNRELWYAMNRNKLRPVFLWILLKLSLIHI